MQELQNARASSKASKFVYVEVRVVLKIKPVPFHSLSVRNIKNESALLQNLESQSAYTLGFHLIFVADENALNSKQNSDIILLQPCFDVKLPGVNLRRNTVVTPV